MDIDEGGSNGSAEANANEQDTSLMLVDANALLQSLTPLKDTSSKKKVSSAQKDVVDLKNTMEPEVFVS